VRLGLATAGSAAPARSGRGFWEARDSGSPRQGWQRPAHHVAAHFGRGPAIASDRRQRAASEGISERPWPGAFAGGVRAESPVGQLRLALAMAISVVYDFRRSANGLARSSSPA